MILKYIVGILAVLFGIYQMVNSYKYVKVEQHYGNKTTSNFTAFTVWYSFLFGLFFFIFGVAFLLTKGTLF